MLLIAGVAVLEILLYSYCMYTTAALLLHLHEGLWHEI